ncbi:MAG: sensor histidine kinase [Streptosporangiaceae bacterium]
MREPQPGIAQLAALVDGVRSTGLPVTLQVDGEPPPDSAAVGPSVYRIVQESLTNVLKHAGHARVNVQVSWARPPSTSSLRTTARDAAPPARRHWVMAWSACGNGRLCSAEPSP